MRDTGRSTVGHVNKPRGSRRRQPYGQDGEKQPVSPSHGDAAWSPKCREKKSYGCPRPNEPWHSTRRTAKAFGTRARHRSSARAVGVGIVDRWQARRCPLREESEGEHGPTPCPGGG